MLTFKVDPSGAHQAVAEAQARVLQAIYLGMREGMTEAAEVIALAAPSKTGELKRDILKSVRVNRKGNLVAGTINAGYGGGLPVGIWREFGTNVPQVSSVKAWSFTAPDGTQVWTRKRAAFRVAPKPFALPAFEASKARIVATIQEHIEGAL